MLLSLQYVSIHSTDGIEKHATMIREQQAGTLRVLPPRLMHTTRVPMARTILFLHLGMTMTRMALTKAFAFLSLTPKPKSIATSCWWSLQLQPRVTSLSILSRSMLAASCGMVISSMSLTPRTVSVSSI